MEVGDGLSMLAPGKFYNLNSCFGTLWNFLVSQELSLAFDNSCSRYGSKSSKLAISVNS